MKFLFNNAEIMNNYEISEMMAWIFRLEDKAIKAREHKGQNCGQRI